MLTTCSLTISLYFVMAMVSIINAEIFPLWVLNDKAHGGFNFQVIGALVCAS